MRRRYVVLLLASLASTCTGCGETPRSGTTPVATSPADIAKELEFASTSDALVALTSAYSQNRKENIRGIESWMLSRSASVLPELSAAVSSEQTPFPQRLIGCRALARLGSGAIPSLMELTNHSVEQLKYRAAESMSIISPHDRESVEALAELLKRDDSRMKSYAIRGLGQAGRLAKAFVPDIEAILNDYSQSDGVRNDAKLALRRIDPRKGLQGLNPDQ